MKIKIVSKVMFVSIFLLMTSSLSFAAVDQVTNSDFTNTGLVLYGSDGTPAANTGTTAGVAGVTTIGKTSSGVTINCTSDINGYTIAAVHKNGTKAYGSSFDSTSLYAYDVVPGTIPTEFALATTASSEFDNWDEQ